MTPFAAAYRAVLNAPASGGGGASPPSGMVFLYAENGTPIVDKNSQQVYAKEPV